MNSLKITLKAAATLDGKIATKTGDSKWITGDEARKAVHILRSQHDAIVVGINTVLADNPRLTTRDIPDGKSPVRIILDSQCRIPLGSACLADDGVLCLIVVGSKSLGTKKEALQKQSAAGKHFHLLQAPTPQPQIKWLLPQLAEYKINRLLVEGGSRIHASFIREDCADHLVLFLSGKLIGGNEALCWCGDLNGFELEKSPQLKIQSMRMVGEDMMVHADFIREIYE